MLDSHPTERSAEGAGRPPGPENELAAEVLLQEHRMLLNRQLAIRLLYRLLCALNVGLLAFLNHLSIPQLAMSASLIVVLCPLWSLERASSNEQLFAVQEALAVRSTEVWEDAYIKRRYHGGVSSIANRVLYHEPWLWLVVTLVLTVIRASLVWPTG
jgi:hypothetical protein